MLKLGINAARAGELPLPAFSLLHIQPAMDGGVFFVEFHPALICIANSDRKYLPVFDAADIHFAVTVSDAVGVGGQR